MIATKTTHSISYLLIGSGRVARHIAHYFHLLNISFDSWDRSQDPIAINHKVQKSTHVLLAISDSALAPFFRQYLAGQEKTVVHFSGAHAFDDMIAAHPLMTFGADLYDLEFYQKIHFSITGAQGLKSILPGLPNSFSILSAQDKARYHALCVMGGNFVSLLILKMLADFKELGIPPEAARLYVEKTVENVFSNPSQALTGPLVRKDIPTVEANLNALAHDPAQEIYKSFLKTFWPDYPRK